MDKVAAKALDTVVVLGMLGALVANYAMDLGYPEWLAIALAAGSGLAVRKSPGLMLERSK